MASMGYNCLIVYIIKFWRGKILTNELPQWIIVTLLTNITLTRHAHIMYVWKRVNEAYVLKYVMHAMKN